MIKNMSKIMTWHVKKVTILRRNVPVVCGASYHLLGYWILQDSKIRFWLHVKSYIGDWRFSKSRLLASYVFCHTAMAYDRHPRLWTPTFGHLTIYSSPQVTLMHLMADAIQLGLCVTKQEVPQLLVRFGDCLVVSLLGLLELLLSLLNLHLAGLNINVRQDGVLGTHGLKEILQCLRLPYNSLG